MAQSVELPESGFLYASLLKERRFDPRNLHLMSPESKKCVSNCLIAFIWPPLGRHKCLFLNFLGSTGDTKKKISPVQNT
jgi:hypothetical protein